MADVKPIVVGAPRTGFSLLIHVISQLLPMTGHVTDRRSNVLRAFTDLAGNHISDAILREAAALGKANELVYNPNFRYVAGGPRWVQPEQPDVACFRKYIGVRGHGDFTLITRHPRALFESQDVLHTHSHPAHWVSNPAEAGLSAFASQRNPIGTLYSSCFSLNALSSEYLQHFTAPEIDNDELREHLALYKLTDLNFFAGLISPLKTYLDEFIEVRDRYRYVMRWEDLLTYPTRTIAEIGGALGLVVDDELAAEIWNKMAWRNLTGWHRHNYRRGHGIVGGWRRYLTNEHLALMRDMGLERISRAMGYGPIQDIDPSEYTPYQSKVANFLSRGEVYREYPDRWLFEFAFNKSNLDSTAFSFKRYGWRENTQVERSSMDDEGIVLTVWSAAEAAAANFNAGLKDLLTLPFDQSVAPIEMLNAFVLRHSTLFSRREGIAREMLLGAWNGLRVEPLLLNPVREFNIVQFGQAYYGIPQRLGPIDFFSTDPTGLLGVVKGDSYEAVASSVVRDAIES
jgi:hypothetical protein